MSTWKCKSCGDEDIPGDKLMDHLRLFHTDEMPETWPDGGPVIYEWE